MKVHEYNASSIEPAYHFSFKQSIHSSNQPTMSLFFPRSLPLPSSTSKALSPDSPPPPPLFYGHSPSPLQNRRRSSLPNPLRREFPLLTFLLFDSLPLQFPTFYLLTLFPLFKENAYLTKSTALLRPRRGPLHRRGRRDDLLFPI